MQPAQPPTSRPQSAQLLLCGCTTATVQLWHRCPRAGPEYAPKISGEMLQLLSPSDQWGWGGLLTERKRAGHGEGPQNTQHAWRGISNARIPLCQPGATLGGLCWKRNPSPPPCSPYCELVSRPQLVPVMMLLLLQRDEHVSVPH